ncbi:hypothetical protein MNBD_ALPHA05-508, partial [hydrothermal vent metagenome]
MISGAAHRRGILWDLGVGDFMTSSLIIGFGAACVA